jgi:hypothetical protein
LEILREWERALTDSERAYTSSRRGKALAITDQLAFNMLLEQNILPVASVPDDWRVIWAMNGTLKLAPLPTLTFTNGHVFFYQHLPRLHGVKVRRWLQESARDRVHTSNLYFGR